MCLSRESVTLATLADTRIDLWNVRDGTHKVAIQTTAPSTVCFSPSGETLASASEANDAITLWRAVDGACLAELKRHTGRVHSLCFSPDGTVLASASQHSLVLWY